MKNQKNTQKSPKNQPKKEKQEEIRDHVILVPLRSFLNLKKGMEISLDSRGDKLAKIVKVFKNGDLQIEEEKQLSRSVKQFPQRVINVLSEKGNIWVFKMVTKQDHDKWKRQHG